LRLTDYLASLGVPTSGWLLPIAWGISTDGRTVVGAGYRSQRSEAFLARIPAAACYANCDNSTVAPVLNVGDFTCFLQRFAAGELYANCDQSTTAPVLNVGDFTCFLQRFAAGCP
jgi:hypothetical protein